MKYVSLNNRKIMLIGFGSIGTTVLPMLFKHIEISRNLIDVVSDSDANYELAKDHGVNFINYGLTPENYKNFLSSRLKENDILLNLSVGVSCFDIIQFCQENKILYLDTSNETWPSTITHVKTTTFERREKTLLNLEKFKKGTTALIGHGANPGLVSHFAKKAVLEVASSFDENIALPQTQAEWANLAEASGIIALHISEKDSQISSIERVKGEFVNTWSVDALFEEASENAGFAWGTHEKELSKEVVKRRINGACRVIELMQLGAQVKMNSWVPSGMFNGYLIPHPEAFSIAEYFCIKKENYTYHPTVHFVYQPCPDAVNSMQEAQSQGWENTQNKRLLKGDIFEGKDELGVLAIRRHSSEIFWFGSRLNIHDAKQLIPNTNATSIQVAAGVLSGLIWMIENPNQGLVEPEQVDFERVLEIATPYLGEFGGYWSRWPEESFPKVTSEALKSLALPKVMEVA